MGPKPSLLRFIVALGIALGLVGVCNVARAETRTTFARMLGEESDVALLTTFDDDTKKLFPDLVAKAARPTRSNLLGTAKALADRIRAAKARGSVDFYSSRSSGIVSVTRVVIAADDRRRWKIPPPCSSRPSMFLRRRSIA